jgi:hypothetical protein
MIDEKIGMPQYLTDWYYSKVKYPINDSNEFYLLTKNSKFSYVYVFYNPNTKFYKIGITKNLNTRQRQISTQSGCYLELVLAIELLVGYDEHNGLVEYMLHKFFKNKKQIGEWFLLDVKSILSIKNLFEKIAGEMIINNIKEHYKTIKSN